MEMRKDFDELFVRYESTTEIFNHIKGSPWDEEQSTRFNPYSWDETLQHLTKGWSGSKALKVASDKISEMRDHSGTTTEFDVTGDFIDIGDYLTGVPECWGSMIEDPKPLLKLSIMIEAGVGGSRSSSEIENRGAAILAMIDAFREKGFFLDITINSSCDGMDSRRDRQVQLNFDTANGYSRDLLAFCVAHPCFLRRIVFAIRHKESHDHDYNGYSKDGDPRGYDIHIRSMNTDQMQWDTLDQAKGNIDRIIDRIMKGAK